MFDSHFVSNRKTLKNIYLLSTAWFLSIFLQLNSSVVSEQTGNEDEVNDTQTISFHIDYKKSCSELCLIGEKYDTDKSSQRKEGHSHPYTLFYNSIFKDKKDANLAVAELGIWNGASLLMWQEYFNRAKIYGFDNNVNLIQSFKENFNNDRIALAEINVLEPSSIANALSSFGIQYDLIIDDTTHLFEDQLRIIENAHCYLKPGGMLIIEDIFKSDNEQDYIDKLKPIINMFQDHYFVSMDHENRRSPGWDNDKILVLVKDGAEPIFKTQKKITLITPSMRPENLIKVRESIDFNYVDEWIIVYDGSKLSENPYLFADENNKKIKEYIYKGEGISGNPQRNYALDHIENENTYLYFLDDDNAIHKDLYKLIDILDDDKIYTFDQENRIKGDVIEVGRIDTAMFLIDFQLCKTIRWVPDLYCADGIYISECYSNNKDKWIYVNNTLCTYNSL